MDRRTAIQITLSNDSETAGCASRHWKIGFAAACLLFASVLGVSCVDYDAMLVPYVDNELLGQHRYALGEQYITVDGLRLCYQEAGQGETILIVPGLGTSIDFWQLNIPVLAENYHVVAVDPPGFGKSDKPDVDYKLRWINEMLISFMDAKDIEQAAIIGGSMGGHLGLLMALDYPGRISKLLTMGSAGTWPEPVPWLDFVIQNVWQDIFAINYMTNNWPELYHDMIKYETPITEEIFRYQMALRADGDAYLAVGTAASRALKDIFYSSCIGKLDQITCPVLLIWGEDDKIHPREEALYMREHISDSRLLVVADSAHEVMIDQTELFNRLVLTFMASGTSVIEDYFEPYSK